MTPRQHGLHQEEKERSHRADWLARLEGKGSPLSRVSERSYLELLDWTGRQIRADKPGAIPASLAPILTRVDINTEKWLGTVSRYGSLFYRVAGRAETLLTEAMRKGLRWIRGNRASREAFAIPPT